MSDDNTTSASPSPEMPDSHPEPEPDRAWRGLVCAACLDGQHDECERPAWRMSSWLILAVCECAHPSHGVYSAPESEAR